MKKTVLFLFPFGKGMGVGHLVRQSVLARELRSKGYETTMWTTGEFSEIPASLVSEMQESFSQVLKPAVVIDENSRFPAAVAVAELEKIENLAAVIMDDYRMTGNPERKKTLEAIQALCKKRGAKFVMVDGVRGLEFDHADVIWNMELGLDESLYPPAWKAKMIRGLEFALLRPLTMRSEPIADKLPENSFFIMIGGTDPRNSSQSILEGMRGLGYNPILVAMKSDKPEDAARMEKLKKTLAEFPQSAWLSNLNGSQMNALHRHAKFAIVGPGTGPCAEAFYTRCPIIGAWTNPSLEANVKALEGIGMPILRATNHDAFMKSWEDKASTLEGTFDAADVKAAVKKLEGLGFVQNRLPERSPFNQVDGKGAARMVVALGLSNTKEARLVGPL